MCRTISSARPVQPEQTPLSRAILIGRYLEPGSARRPQARGARRAWRGRIQSPGGFAHGLRVTQLAGGFGDDHLLLESRPQTAAAFKPPSRRRIAPRQPRGDIRFGHAGDGNLMPGAASTSGAPVHPIRLYARSLAQFQPRAGFAVVDAGSDMCSFRVRADNGRHGGHHRRPMMILRRRNIGARIGRACEAEKIRYFSSCMLGGRCSLPAADPPAVRAAGSGGVGPDGSVSVDVRQRGAVFAGVLVARGFGDANLEPHRRSDLALAPGVDADAAVRQVRNEPVAAGTGWPHLHDRPGANQANSSRSGRRGSGRRGSGRRRLRVARLQDGAVQVGAAQVGANQVGANQVGAGRTASLRRRQAPGWRRSGRRRSGWRRLPGWRSRVGAKSAQARQGPLDANQVGALASPR